MVGNYLFTVILKRNYFISATSCDATSTLAPTNQPSTPCLTYTTGGNAKGAFCQFPYRYKGRAYYECTRRDNRKLWCSTTADYDNDLLWGVCSGNRLVLLTTSRETN